jgi:hypothetical protein
MPELAVTDGMPPPADLPRGECIITALYDDHGQRTGIRIDHADPRILISAELLHMIADGDGKDAWLDLRASGMFFLTGAVLHINAVNQRAVYRITEYVPRVRGYIGEWPD